MKQQSLESHAVLERYGARVGGSCFWTRWSRWFRWSVVCNLLSRAALRVKAGNGRRPAGDHAANLLCAAMVQSVGSRCGRGVVRVCGAAAIRWCGSSELLLRRTRHHLPLPPSAGEARSGRSDAGGCGTYILEARGIRHCDRHNRRCDHHPPRLRRPRTPAESATRRCTRPVKGNQWYFGLKAHIGVDSKEGVVRRYVRPLPQWRTSKCCPTYCTARSVRYGGDGGYQGQTDSIHQAAPHCRRI